MSWKKFLTAIGAGESVVKSFEDLGDKEMPDEDLKKLSDEFLNDRISHFKSSDEYKKAIKEADIVSSKKFRKALAVVAELDLSNEEIGKMTNDEFSEKLKEHLGTQYESRQNSKTADIQKKLDEKISEFNKFKTENETKFKKLETDLVEANGRYETKIKQDKIDGILRKSIDDPNRKWTDKENGEIIIRSMMDKNGIWLNDEGVPKKGDRANPEVVTAADGKTILKDANMLVDHIASERKLYQKSQSGGNVNGQQPTGFQPTGVLTDEQKNLVTHDLNLLESMNNRPKK